MKKRQILMGMCGLAAIVLIAVITVILIVRDMGMIRTNCELYFMNEAETSIESELREIKYSDPKRLPENVIMQLMKGPENSKHKRLINRETKLLHLTNDDGKINVDMSREFLSGNSAKNMQAIYSIVKSLCGIEGVSQVRVTVQGEEIKSSSGAAVGYLTADDINLSTDSNTSETNQITLYFTDKSGSRLYKTSRTVKAADQQPIEYYIVSGLIRGPQDNKFYPVINKKTELISTDTEGDICFVNLGSDFIEKNKKSKSLLSVYSIVNSLTELQHINRVQFLIDGKRIHKFGTIDIYNTFSRNDELIAAE